MLQGIATQDDATRFKTQLECLVTNLNFHTNSALGKAHGIELVSGYTDRYGNDLRTYQDSFGNNISHGDANKPNFVRFVISNNAYYAPCLFSGLAGQASTTGIVLTSAPNTDIHPASLVTGYVTYEIEAATGLNDFLLTHSLQAHQNAHVAMSVLPEKTLTTAGAVLGNYVVRLVVDNKIYKIPCDTRIGGPSQPPRLGGMIPPYQASNGPSGMIYMNKGSHPLVLGGTRPLTFSYEWAGPYFVYTQFADSGFLPNTTLQVPSYRNGLNTPHATWCYYDANNGGYWCAGVLMAKREYYVKSQVRLTATGPSVYGSPSTHKLWNDPRDMLFNYEYIEQDGPPSDGIDPLNPFTFGLF